MTRIRYPVVFGTVFFALSLVSTADAELYLMFNVGDGEDRAVQVAATSWEAVMNGSRASKIDSNADWIEYEASAASLMLFSPDGLDEESDIRFEPARVFMRRVNGSVYVMITGQNGTPP